jgi:hypothetical protein
MLLVGITASTLSYAQVSGDPTKPPAVWLAMQPKPYGVGAVEVEAAGTPGAQIVIVGPTRKFAMVDGQAVRPGETYKGSKLLNIGPDGLVWQTEGRRELTSMSPGVQKTDPAARQPKQPGTKAGQKH